MPNLKPIQWTQFLFPRGTKTQVEIDRPEAIAVMAEKLKAKGFSFEIENKMGRIWMSIVDHDTDTAYDEISHNGPGLEDKLDNLIKKAFYLEY